MRFTRALFVSWLLEQIMNFSQILNIFGVLILAVEAFDARGRIEKVIDALRIFLFKILKSYWFIFLLPFVFFSMEAYAIVEIVQSNSWHLADTYFAIIFILVIGVIIYLFVMIVLFGIAAFLHLIDRFPNGSVAGLGATLAVIGLILDFSPNAN